MITISRVKTNTDLRQFIGFPFSLNAGDPAFASDLVHNQMQILQSDHNPFLKNAEIRAYLALDGNQILGRIASIHNTSHQQVIPELGRFGFFDCVHDKTIAKHLMEAVENDMHEWKYTRLLGPLNPSFNDSLGVLVEGFSYPPYYEMPHNPPYYDQLLTEIGLVKERDYLAYLLSGKDFPDRLLKAAPVLQDRFDRRGIQIRLFNPDDFDQEIESIRQVYNKAFIDNPEFAPASTDQFQFYFQRYKRFLDPELIYLAEFDDQVIGFALGMPNLNEYYQGIPRGKKKWYMGASATRIVRNINTVRIMATAILPDFRRFGIDSFFFSMLFETAREKGYKAAEASRIAEDNEPMINAMNKMDAEAYKRYRLYSRKLTT